MKKIYLASPFTNDDPEVEKQRYEDITDVAGKLMLMEDLDLVVYSPITHSYPIHIKHNLPGDWEYWKRYDMAFLEWANEMWIWAMDKAWQKSEGIKNEMIIARGLKKPIKLLFIKTNETFVFSDI